jgi:hypothetical protein
MARAKLPDKKSRYFGENLQDMKHLGEIYSSNAPPRNQAKVG